VDLSTVRDDSLAKTGPPLVLDAKGQLLFFRTAAHLEAYVEAVDVLNGEYGTCWDADGRLLTLTVEKRQETVLGVLSYPEDVVRAQVVEGEPSHLTDLHLALLRYLSDCGLDAEMPTTNDTTDILEFAIEQFGWS
jgi:hypothetical protein